jgi:VanZ family protein
MLQVFVPGRTPSLLDVSAQSVGTLAGIAAWAVLGREVRVVLLRFFQGSRRALEMVLAGYAFWQFLRLIEPLDVTVELSVLAQKYAEGGIVLNPLSSPSLHWALLPSMLSEVVLAAPVGALAAIAGRPSGARRTIVGATALASLFFLAGESAQLFIRSRAVDALDLLTNCVGAALGALVAGATVHRVGDRATGSAHPLLSAALVLSAVFYVVYNLSPFDFIVSRRFVADRIDMLTHVPFRAYYINPEFKALADAVTKISIALPLGLFFQLRFRPDATAFARLLTVAWLMTTGLFFAAVEVGQLLLPSRFPDNTDILLAVCGVWLGMKLAYAQRDRSVPRGPSRYAKAVDGTPARGKSLAAASRIARSGVSPADQARVSTRDAAAIARRTSDD